MKIRRIHIRLSAGRRGAEGHAARQIAEAAARSLADRQTSLGRVSVELDGQGRSGAVLASAVGSAVARRLRDETGG
jgi:hypothetical protein